MRSVVAFGLLFIAHAEVQEDATDPLLAHLMSLTDSEKDEFAEKFVGKLVNKLYDATGMQLSAVSDSTNDGTYKFSDKLINELNNGGQFVAPDSPSMAITTGDERYPNSYVLGDDAAANYAYDRYNSDIDPNMAAAAKVAVAMMNQKTQAAPGLEEPTRDWRYPNSYTLGDDDAANYGYLRYNSDIDPNLASGAKAAVSQMQQNRQLQAPQEQELAEMAESSTDSMGMAAVAPMFFFVGGLLTFVVYRFRSSADNKEAFMEGYSPIHA